MARSEPDAPDDGPAFCLEAFVGDLLDDAPLPTVIQTGPAPEHPVSASSEPRPLQRLGFRRYWLARLLAQTAQSALLYGLLIVLVDQTQASVWPSLFVACSILPSLLFSLFGGWVADVLPQQALLVVLNLVRAALVLLLVSSDTDLLRILGVTLGIWTVHQFFSPAESALLGRLVPSVQIPSAAALANLALNLAQLLGVVILAPLLLKFRPPRELFALCALGYALGAVFLVRLGTLADGSDREARPHRRPAMSLRRGWRVLVHDNPALGALVDSVLVGAGMSSLVVIVPYYIDRVLGIAANNTAYVFAPAAIGLLVGIALTPRLGRLIPYHWLATIGLVLFALVVAGFGMIDRVSDLLRTAGVPLDTLDAQLGLAPRIAATMLLAIPAGFAGSVVNVATRTVFLERVPVETRGQVFATQMVLANVAALLPTLTAGLLVDLVRVRALALALAALLVVGAALGRRLAADDEPASVSQQQEA